MMMISTNVKLLSVNGLIFIAGIGTFWMTYTPVDAVSLPSSSKFTPSELIFDSDSVASTYTFEQFLSDFGRSYYNDIEYQEREIIFYDNLRTIVEHNRKQQHAISTTTTTTSSHNHDSLPGKYIMGINPYTDRRPEELHRGYDKYQSTIVRTTSSSNSITERQRRLHSKNSNNNIDVSSQMIEENLGIRIDHVNELPKSIDWRTLGVTTPIKSQGQCGSCWAFASTAVLESHIAIRTGYVYELSMQELVSCTKNTYHCGGNGGCSGATAEIAFDLVKQFGIVQEWTFGYQDSTALPINCSLTMNPPTEHDKMYFHNAVAAITDYMVLPSNNYTILMNVVAKYGPVAVSVACMPWHLYQSGIFYEPFNRNNNATTDLDHLVVLEGYGTDVETNEDYWLVRNSWGPRWGEHGYIRLKRQSHDDEEEKDCGYDVTPADGTACMIDPTTGKEITPLPQRICGNSGILFDSSVPIGGHLL